MYIELFGLWAHFDQYFAPICHFPAHSLANLDLSLDALHTMVAKSTKPTGAGERHRDQAHHRHASPVVLDSSSERKHWLTIVIPARNEADALRTLLPKLRECYPEAEIIVVDDDSTDGTTEVCTTSGAKVIRHPYGMGNGAAIKAGCRAAGGEVLVFMDGDGQHDPADIPRLLEKLEEGYDMAVGARNAKSQASAGRSIANRFYNWLASWMVGHPISDLTSGFRAVRASRFREFLHLLPNGFSYPTTITMAFFRAGYPVAYVPIRAYRRLGKSHIRVFRDGIRFFLIIFKVGTLYSPLKLFVPMSASFFILGIGYYLYTFANEGRFTNMSALLLSTSIIIFLIGLVSEQITSLIYTPTSTDQRSHS